MDSSNSGAVGYRLGAWGAAGGGILRLSIAAAYALTGLGAAGDLSYGSFTGLTFIPETLLAFGALGLYRAFSSRVSRGGRLGLAAAVAGLTLSAVGLFGGARLGFPRSGNYLIGPGAVLVIAGLTIFAAKARRSPLPRVYSNLVFSIGLLPLVFFPVVIGIELLLGSGFPPALHDNYFRALNVLTAVIWIVLGVALSRESRSSV